MKKLLSLLIAVAMLFSLVACGGGEEGGETTTDEPSTKLVVYSPNSDGLINAVIPAFEAETGITVELIQAGTGELITRLESEKANPQADVLWGGANIANYEAHPDLFAEYVSPNDANLPEAYQNYKGFVSHYCLDGSAALLVNTDVFAKLGLDPEEFKGYSDLLWPELKGQICMGDPAGSSSAWAELTNMLLVMGDEPYDEKAWEWVESFIANLDGKVSDSSSKIYKGTADGEWAVGVSYEDPCVGLLVDGATNLKLVYPEEGAVWLPAGAGIIAGGPNAENAKKFIDFLQSDAGQNAVATTTARPVNTSINNTAPEMTPFSEINVAVEDIPYCSENKPAWQQRWIDLVTQ